MKRIYVCVSDLDRQLTNRLVHPQKQHTQGTFETDTDRVIRIKYYQQYGFGQYPNALVFDKIDIVRGRVCAAVVFLCACV